MKIGLIGYGKMGKEIEKIALERGHEIAFYVNSKHPIETINLNDADVCIEFSVPDLALQHIQVALQNKKPLVVGTTGWNEHLDKVTEWVNQTNGSLVHASNFSIGVNLFFQLNEQLARLMNSYNEYKVAVTEIHHTGKKDYPSGTAITLTEGIIHQSDKYTGWKADLNQMPSTDHQNIPIESDRIADVPGTHTISYTSEIDTIKIEHLANNRKGFALGAVVAAEWVVQHKGIHTFRNVLKLN